MKQHKMVGTLLKIAWTLELTIAIFILLVTVLQMFLTAKDSLNYLSLGQFSLTQFFASTMTIVVGLEFVKMLILHTPRAVTDVLLFAIARQLVVSHSTSLDTLLGVAAVAIIFIIKKFLLTEDDSVSPANLLEAFNRFRTGEQSPEHAPANSSTQVSEDLKV